MGTSVDTSVGTSVGASVGAFVGASVGAFVGVLVGASVGVSLFTNVQAEKANTIVNIKIIAITDFLFIPFTRSFLFVTLVTK